MGVGWHRVRSPGRQSLQIPTSLKDMSLLPLCYLHQHKSQELQESCLATLTSVGVLMAPRSEQSPQGEEKRQENTLAAQWG